MKLAQDLAALFAVLLVPVAVVGCTDDDSSSGSISIPGLDAGVSFPDGGNPPGTAPIDTTLTSTPDAVTNKAEARFEFTSSRPGKFGCRVDDQTPAECTSPFTTTVKEGPHTFEVAAAASDGAVDTTPAKFTWTVDTTPPKTTITKAPPAFDNSTNVSFEFTASEKATFRCAIDEATPATCASPFAATKLTDGPHTFSVTATDEAGNVETPPATHTWTIDTTLPDTQIDSGPSGSVNTTSSTFTFSSPTSGSTITFECSVDTAPFTACTSPQTVTSTGDGPRTFRVRAHDASGNVDPTPAERTWTVDTVAPTVSITGGPSGPTKTTAPSFSFVTGGNPKTIECRVDSGAFAACTSPYTTTTLPEGSHTVEVRVKDDAGNTASATRGFTVDTMVPSVTITGGPSGPTNVVTPTFTFTAEAGATVTCSVDGGAPVACNATFTTTTLTEGNHSFQVQATDGAGNTASASRSFSVDTTTPVVTILNGPNGTTNVNAGTFTFSVSEASTTNLCRVGNGAFSACTTSYAYGPLTDNAYTFEVQATDAAGNVGTATRSFTVDTTPPTVTFTGGPSGPTNVTSPSFTFTTTGATSTKCRLDAGAYATCTSPYSPGTLAQGGHTVYVQASDGAGNTTTTSRSFSIDTTPPTAQITGGPSSVVTGSAVTFTFTAETGATKQYRIYTTGSPSGTYSACTSPLNVTAPLGTGSWTFELRVTDAAGNSTIVTWQFYTYIIG